MARAPQADRAYRRSASESPVAGGLSSFFNLYSSSALSASAFSLATATRATRQCRRSIALRVLVIIWTIACKFFDAAGRFDLDSHLQMALRDGRVGCQRRRCARPHDLPLFDDRVPVGELHERGEMLVDEQNGLALRF